MSVIDPSSLTVGQKVAFKSLGSFDNVLWTGTITAICLYDAVNNTADVVPYYKEMLKEYPTLADVEKLTFIQLTLLENYESQRYRYFATDWIDPSTLTVIDQTSSYAVRIYNISEDQVATALELLRSHGYLCQQVSTS